MARSGMLIFCVSAAVMLTGCSSVSQHQGSPAQPESTTPAQAEAACPSGLKESLEAFLATVPWDGELPRDVDVIENSEDYAFSSDVIASLSGCTLTTVATSSAGDRMAQIYGISSLSESEVVAASV